MTLTSLRYAILMLVGTVLAFTLSGTAHSAVVYHDNEAGFSTAYTDTLVLESFEAQTVGDTPPIVTTGFTMATSDGDGAINEYFPGVYPTDGDNYFGWGYPENATLTFTFNSPVWAFAVDITDLASAGDTAITFENSNGDSFNVPYSNFGTHGALDFFGVTSDTPFSSLTLTFQTSEWLGLDRVQTGVVPVPAALWLLASGLAALAATGRRRRS